MAWHIFVALVVLASILIIGFTIVGAIVAGVIKALGSFIQWTERIRRSA